MVDRELAWKKHPRPWKSSFRTWKAPCALKSFWIHIPVTMKKINSLERQSCSKFPATFEKPVALGKTALYHATFTTTMRLLGFGFHARSIFMRKKCAKCSQGDKTQFFMRFHIFSRLFHILFVPFSLLFVAKKQNTWKLWRISPTWSCVTFPRLAAFGQDMRLLSVTLFSLAF